MAKPIESTPVLTGADADELRESLPNHASPEEMRRRADAEHANISRLMEPNTNKTVWDAAIEAMSGIDGISELRIAPGEHGPTLYVVLATRDVDRDFVISERLFPLRVEYELVPLRSVGMVPEAGCEPSRRTRVERLASIMYPAAHRPDPCGACQMGEFRMVSDPGRTVQWARGQHVILPDWLPLPTCDHCGERKMSRAVMREIQELHRQQFGGK